MPKGMFAKSKKKLGESNTVEFWSRDAASSASWSKAASKYTVYNPLIFSPHNFGVFAREMESDSGIWKKTSLLAMLAIFSENPIRIIQR